MLLHFKYSYSIHVIYRQFEAIVLKGGSICPSYCTHTESVTVLYSVRHSVIFHNVYCI